MRTVEFIAHRINSASELKGVDDSFGVEVDLRDSNEGLHIAHDPFSEGDSFEEYLKNYTHGTMIINVKSERIEHRILDSIKGKKLKYFFLDSTFPMIKLLSAHGEKNIALRFSEFEGLDTLVSMAGKVDWVWVDCFTKFPMDKQAYDKIHELGYKICIVSPELQNQDEKIELYAKYMKDNNITPDAICSKLKNFERWSSYFQFVDKK